MKIESLRVRNYRAFQDTGVVELSPNITVFAGRNNSGKSALLEALRFTRISSRPFRRGINDPGSGQSRIDVTLSISGREILDALKFVGGAGRIVIPANHQGLANRQLFVDNYFSAEKLKFAVSKVGDGPLSALDGPSHGMFAKEAIAGNISVDINQNGFPIANEFVISAQSDTIPGFLSALFDKRVFVFSAQRTVGSIEKFGRAEYLDPVGLNLPNALNTLQGTYPRKFQRFKNYVQTILPDISNISVEPAGAENIDIRVWTESADPVDKELSISLSECGTGVGQILALVYAAMTEKPSLIAIDEPNSFLHPSAVKSLLNVLCELENQYILTTHSADIVSRSEHGRIYNLIKKEGTVQCEEINTKNISQVRSMLNDLGVSLTDVNGFQ